MVSATFIAANAKIVIICYIKECVQGFILAIQTYFKGAASKWLILTQPLCMSVPTRWSRMVMCVLTNLTTLSYIQGISEKEGRMRDALLNNSLLCMLPALSLSYKENNESNDDNQQHPCNDRPIEQPCQSNDKK